MAHNRIKIAAPPEEVFDVLSDPDAYPVWVVGTKEVLAADDEWPSPEARLTYELVGGGSGETVVVDCLAPRRLILATQLPVGRVRITIDLVELDDGTELHLDETFENDLAHLAFDAGLHARNATAVNRLKAYVEDAGKPARGSLIRALNPLARGLDAGSFTDVFAGADQCYLAVAAPAGVDVTPVAFAFSSGRVWIVTPRSSVKRKAIARESGVGVLVRAGDRSLMIEGDATVLDPARSLIPEHGVERLFALPALASYVAANANRIGGIRGAFGTLIELNPAARVLLSIAPERITVLEGNRVVAERGPTYNGDVGRLQSVRSAAIDLSDAPSDIESMAELHRRCALAWMGVDRPIAIPGRWDPESTAVFVPAELLQGLTASSAAVCLDEAESSEIEDQRGLLVRGTGRVTSVDGSIARVEVEQDRTTIWEGQNTAKL